MKLPLSFMQRLRNVTQHTEKFMRLMLVWAPFMILWTFFMLVYTDFGLAGSFLSGVTNTAAAAFPGIGIWYFTARYRWPDTVKLVFYSVHVGIGTVFAGFWMLSSGLTAPYYLGLSFAEYFSNPSTVLWRLMMGLFIYGCVTGVCYALHNHNRLQVQAIEMHRIEALAMKAELKSLRARLSPHFIFNALHSISALMSKDMEKAEDAIERLGYLLRYVLEEKGETYIPFSEEWSFTKNYFELERMRLENDVKLVSEISHDASEFEVIPLLLQPLVENSLKHGRFQFRGNNFVKVVAKVENRTFFLKVEDNGGGLGGSRSAENCNSHYGLSILSERLNKTYNKAATLNIDDSFSQGLQVRVTIPCVDHTELHTRTLTLI